MEYLGRLEKLKAALSIEEDMPEPVMQADPSWYEVEGSVEVGLTPEAPTPSTASSKSQQKSSSSKSARESPTPASTKRGPGRPRKDKSSPPRSSKELASRSSASSPDTRQLTAAAACRYTSALVGFPIPPSTFYRWLDEGIIPASRFVKRWLVRPEAIREFVKQNSW